MRARTLSLVALFTALPACVVVSNPPQGTAQPEPSVPIAQGPTPAASAPSTPPAASAPSTPPAASAPSTPPPSTSGSPGQGPGGEAALLGTWRSASCGSRQYERVISFSKDNRFTAEDRVSPCPPKVACVWSGIVMHQGTFKLAGSAISLSPSQPSKGPGAQPLPTSLGIEPKTGAPFETAEGGKVCVYQR